MTMTVENSIPAVIDLNKVHKKFQDALVRLNGLFLDREVAITCMLVGILARQHVLLVGPPGTAKSDLSRVVFEQFSGVKTFDKLLTKFTSPEEVFGPFSITKLMNDEYTRNLIDYLADADFAMLDEIGKASSAILNSLLTQMNERIYHNGNTVVQTPLQMLVGASNELPDGDELAALYDRFPLRVEVQYLSDVNFDLYLGTKAAANVPPMITPINRAELAAAQADIANVTIGKDVIANVGKLRGILRDDGFVASDRRWGQSLKLLQAHAWLNGRTAVDDDDYEVLQHGLWSRPAERAKIASKVASIANPLRAEVNELVDNVAEIMDNLTAAARKAKDGIKDKDVKTLAMEKHDNIKESQAKLGALMKTHNLPFIQVALDRVKAANKTILSKFFGLSDNV